MTNHIPPLPSAFHEQPEWLRVTLSCIGDGIITTDNQGRVTFLNPVAEALTGWSLADAVGLKLDRVFPIQDEVTRKRLENRVNIALREGSRVGLANHTILMAKDGTERPIEESAAPIRSDSGEVAGVVLVFRDVTQRKRDELLLGDALAYADNIIATMREPFLVLDQSLQVVTANESFYENFQVAASETQGQFVYDLGNRQWDIPALRTLLEEVLPQNHVFQDFLVEHDFPTLGRRTMLLNARRIRKPGNHSELILLAIEDVTERRQIEELHRESEDRFRGTFENAAIGMAHVGLDGRWLRMNQALCRIVGYTSEELATKTFADITHPDDLDADLSNVKRVLAGEIDNYAMEKRYLRKDGSHVFVNLTVSLLRDVDGQPLHFISAVEDISQKKAALVELERERRFNERLTHVMPTVMYVFDLEELCVRWVNPQVATIMGYTKQEILDLKSEVMSHIMHPDDLAKMPAYFASLAEVPDGVALDIEYRMRQPSGEWRWFLGRKTPFTRNAEGRVVEILGTATDITDRKRAEEAQLASEHQLRQILDTMPPKIATTKPNGEVDYFNPQWSEYTGLAFDQLKGKGWKQVIHPEDVTEHVRLWRQSIQTSLPFEFESRLRRADGEYRWHISRAVPLKGESGQITMWVGSNADVHDMKQAEVAVHVSENRYRRLFEAAKDGILILDSNHGKIVDVNPFMSDLLGYSREEFIGKEMWEIGLFRDKSTNEAAVRGLQESGYLRYEHMPLVTKAGRQVQVEIVANVYQEDQQKVIQCNIRNITERSHMEDLLRSQAVEMSDLHRRKDEFLAMLSHELRSPLAPIANAVQLLSLQPETETLIHKKARDIIERQLGQLKHLVDDLLEVSRITTGRVQLRKERVTVNRIVQGAVETARPLIEQRGHTLTVTILPPPIWLDADPSRLEQVIVNLLTNAAKYTEEGGQIHLTAQMEGSECVLRVRDNGVGISPTLLPRIFDLFTQAERSLDRSQGGLGIGLALVQRLTELHGGTVEVQSVLGQGSEFIVRLPLHGDEKRVIAGDVDGGLESPHAPLPPQLRVLVVDDNVDTVLSFSMLLQAAGHEVRTAHDGLTAVQISLDYRPDVMLLDIGLPGLNGYEVAKRVREQPQLRDVVLVALTGYGQDSDRATSLQAGFNHHMVKPASFEQIKQILASVPRLPR